MTDHITACRKCASTYFLVRESYVWSAHLNEGVLGCTHVSTEIDVIKCEECGETCSAADFARITHD
jgi:hypothetical protein